MADWDDPLETGIYVGFDKTALRRACTLVGVVVLLTAIVVVLT